MEPPRKRARLGPGVSVPDPFAQLAGGDDDEDEIAMDPEEFAIKQDPDYRFNVSRAAADNKLKSAFEQLFEKYGKDFGDAGDEINFYTDEIEVDNGHIASLPNADRTGRAGVGALFSGGHADRAGDDADGEDEAGSEVGETEDDDDDGDDDDDKAERGRLLHDPSSPWSLPKPFYPSASSGQLGSGPGPRGFFSDPASVGEAWSVPEIPEAAFHTQPPLRNRPLQMPSHGGMRSASGWKVVRNARLAASQAPREDSTDSEADDLAQGSHGRPERAPAPSQEVGSDSDGIPSPDDPPEEIRADKSANIQGPGEGTTTVTKSATRRARSLRKHSPKSQRSEEAVLVTEHTEQPRQILEITLTPWTPSPLLLPESLPTPPAEAAVDLTPEKEDDIRGPPPEAEDGTRRKAQEVETFTRNELDPSYTFSDEEEDGLKKRDRRPRGKPAVRGRPVALAKLGKILEEEAEETEETTEEAASAEKDGAPAAERAAERAETPKSQRTRKRVVDQAGDRPADPPDPPDPPADETTPSRPAKATQEPTLPAAAPLTPQHQRPTDVPRTREGSHHSSLISLLSDDSADEDELSVGPVDDFFPSRSVQTLATAAAAASSQRTAQLDRRAFLLRRGAYTVRRVKRGSSGTRLALRKAAAAFSSPLRSKHHGLLPPADPEASSPAVGSPVQTPRGSIRRCGQGGFRCGRDFCFHCL